MKLFVYGTLKRGFGNHILLKGSQFIGEDSLKGLLYTGGPRGTGIPFLLPGEATIQGELYEVPDDLVPHLDRLEGHPRWYTREIRKLDSGTEASVYAYNHPEEAAHLCLEASGRYQPSYGD